MNTADTLLALPIEQAVESLTALDYRESSPQAEQEIRDLIRTAMKRGSQAKAARLQLEWALRFAVPSYAEALREVLAKAEEILAEAQAMRDDAQVWADGVRQESDTLYRRYLAGAEAAARREAQEKIAALLKEKEAEILALATERERLEREREAMRAPHAQAMIVLEDIIERAGYGPETDGKTGKLQRREVPSPILCHAAIMVGALCGTNPVNVQFGGKYVAPGATVGRE